MAGRSLAGSTVWPTSAPACHSSRAACPKSGWPRLPYSLASVRSSTEQGSWRRQRTPLPQPPWHPYHPAHPHPPPALPLCLVILATSPAGKRSKQRWETWGLSSGYREHRVTEYLQQLKPKVLSDCPRARHQTATWLGETVSQIYTVIQISGRDFPCKGKEFLVLTKAGSSLSGHWLMDSNIPSFSLFYQPTSRAEWKQGQLFTHESV